MALNDSPPVGRPDLTTCSTADFAAVLARCVAAGAEDAGTGVRPPTGEALCQRFARAWRLGHVPKLRSAYSFGRWHREEQMQETHETVRAPARHA